MSEALQQIVISELTPLGLELFQLRSTGSKGRPVLDVRIERADGNPITVDDCARASRAIEAKLDEGNTLGARYVLEVSSPGIERPLRHAADWRKFVGHDAVVTVDGEGGKQSNREIRIAGVEGDEGNETVVVEDAKGTATRIQLAAIRKARLAFNWKR